MVATVEPSTSGHSANVVQLRIGCMCQCTSTSPSPLSPAHSVGKVALLKPQNHHLEHSKPGRAVTVAKSIHVHKQVVQRKAEKNTPKINHFGMR